MAKRTRKGVFYFTTFPEARAYARKHGFPSNRIIPFQIGWAIQMRISGPYVGPKTKAPRRK